MSVLTMDTSKSPFRIPEGDTKSRWLSAVLRLPKEVRESLGEQVLRDLYNWTKEHYQYGHMVCIDDDEAIKTASIEALLDLNLDIIFRGSPFTYFRTWSDSITTTAPYQTARMLAKHQRHTCLAIPNHGNQPSHWVFYKAVTL